MDNEDTLSLLVEDTKVTVPAKFATVSEYITSLMALGF